MLGSSFYTRDTRGDSARQDFMVNGICNDIYKDKKTGLLGGCVERILGHLQHSIKRLTKI